MKKKVLIIIPVLVLLFCGIIAFLFINSKKLKITYVEKLEVNINEKVYNTDYIKSIKNGKIISKKKIIDTSKLGKVEVSLKLKDYFKNTKTAKYNLVVVDKEAPKITFNDKLSVEEGQEVDLLKDVSVSDNSFEDIKVNVEGEYDLNTPNNYELYYIAKDSSGNISKEKFNLEVTKKVEVPSSNGYVSSDKTFTTSNGHSGVVRDGVTYIDGILIANKTYSLPSSYNPGMQDVFMSNYNQMASDASASGISLRIISGFRSYGTQQGTYAHWVSMYGQATADTISARAGHSEHQSGLAADINSLDQDFEYTAEGKWLNDNCYKYGFIIRFVKGKTNETGYAFEPWHIRYVGKDLAAKLYNNGDWITLESYFGITSQYNY